jgi:hypothetical protein
MWIAYDDDGTGYIYRTKPLWNGRQKQWIGEWVREMTYKRRQRYLIPDNKKMARSLFKVIFGKYNICVEKWDKK